MYFWVIVGIPRYFQKLYGKLDVGFCSSWGAQKFEQSTP